MHLTIVAIGSRGDVQPSIALGQGLQRAGHRARLNTPLDFEALVREHDLEFAPLRGNVRNLMSSEAGISFTETGASPLEFVREFRGIARTMIVEMLGDCLKACEDTDLIVMTGIVGGQMFWQAMRGALNDAGRTLAS